MFTLEEMEDSNTQRKQHAITRSEYARYVAWCNTQHNARFVTERATDEPVAINFIHNTQGE